jgi:tryptophan synthase alpha chain
MRRRGQVHPQAAKPADGLLVLDLPPEESDNNYEALMAGVGFARCTSSRPPRPTRRIALIAPRAQRGFIYYVSREGRYRHAVQGQRRLHWRRAMAKILAHSPLPIVGFGIQPSRQVAQHAEAIVAGSVVVNRIAEHGKSPELVTQVKWIGADWRR